MANHFSENKIRKIDNETMAIIVNSKVHGSREVLIDSADYELVRDFKWVIVTNGRNLYVSTTPTKKKRSETGLLKKMLFMHRFILKPEAREVVDHANCESMLLGRLCWEGENY